MVVPLVRPSADTTELANAAVRGFRSIYAPGVQLAKAGVMLLGLVPDTLVQGALDWNEPTTEPRPVQVDSRHGPRQRAVWQEDGVARWKLKAKPRCRHLGDASGPKDTQLHDAVE